MLHFIEHNVQGKWGFIGRTMDGTAGGSGSWYGTVFVVELLSYWLNAVTAVYRPCT